MVNFVDKTSGRPGTPINRSNMMAVQGFENGVATYSKGKRIVQFASGDTLTTYLQGESVVNTLVGEKTITKTTIITDAGNVEEVLS